MKSYSYSKLTNNPNKYFFSGFDEVRENNEYVRKLLCRIECC